MKVEKCGEKDLLQVADFYDKVTFHLVNSINYPKWRYKDYPSKQSACEAIKNGEQFVCRMDGEILGAFVLNDNPQGAYDLGGWSRKLSRGEYLVIHTLAVKPDSYGRGIGRFMVKFCIEYAKSNGYKAIRLDTVPENIPARRLYEKMGFIFAGSKDLERGIEDIPEFTLYELNF